MTELYLVYPLRYSDEEIKKDSRVSLMAPVAAPPILSGSQDCALTMVEGDSAAAEAAGPGLGGFRRQRVDLYWALGPVYWISRLFGMTPMVVRSGPARGPTAAAATPPPVGRRLEFSAAAFAYGLLVLLIVAPLMIMGLALDLYNYTTGQKTVAPSVELRDPEHVQFAFLFTCVADHIRIVVLLVEVLMPVFTRKDQEKPRETLFNKADLSVLIRRGRGTCIAAGPVRMKNMTSVVAALADLLSIVAAAAAGVLNAGARGGRAAALARQLAAADGLVRARLPEASAALAARNRRVRTRSLRLAAALVAHLVVIFLFDVLVWQGVTGHLPLIYLPVYGLYVLVAVLELQLAVALWCVRERFAQLNELIAWTGAAWTAAAAPWPPRLAAPWLSAASPPPSPRASSRLAAAAAAKRLLSAHHRSLLFRRRRVSDAHGLPSSAASGRGASGVAGGGRGARGGSGVGARIYALCELHGRLFEAVVTLNAAYAVPLLAYVLTLFLHLIITPYFFLLDLLYPVTYGSTDPAFLFLQLCWVGTHVAKLFLIVQPCAALCNEAGKTGALVSQLLTSDFDADVKKQLELFALQLVHRRIEITACGFCTIDFPLIASIAGSVTTYLVILIQFQESGEKPK